MAYMPLAIKYGGGDVKDSDQEKPPARKSRDPYAKVDDLFCPMCGKKAVSKCNCKIGSLKCGEGHDWYYGSDGKAVIGTGHPPSSARPTSMLPSDIKIDSKCHGNPCSHLVLVLYDPAKPWVGMGGEGNGPMHGAIIVDLLKHMKRPIPPHFKQFV